MIVSRTNSLFWNLLLSIITFIKVIMLKEMEFEIKTQFLK